MPVPEEIRKVPRPVNTVVYDNGSDGPDRYAVRARAGSVYVPEKKNSSPINGKTIGHIVDGKFVPIQAGSPENACSDVLSYGASAFVYSVSDGLFDELIRAGFSQGDAYGIMASASLRATERGAADERLSEKYGYSWASVYYPGTDLSEDSVKKLEEKIGMSGDKRERFFRERAFAVPAGHRIIIDAVPTESRGRGKGLMDVSFMPKTGGPGQTVIFACEPETAELVCAEAFFGDNPGADAYADFLRHGGIERGVIALDAGFTPGPVKRTLSGLSDIRHIAPAETDDDFLEEYRLLDYDGVFADMWDDEILYARREGGDGTFFYSFQSKKMSDEEIENYLEKKKTDDAFDNAEYEKFKKKSGVVVFESDLDMQPRDVWHIYASRRLWERVFDCYGEGAPCEPTDERNDLTALGDGFIKFVTAELTGRMIRKARDAGLLRKMTYDELLDDLRDVWRLAGAPDEPFSDDGFWVHGTPYLFEEMEALGLSKPAPSAEPKKRGRPRKNPAKDASAPKRKRGRPGKDAGTVQACMAK